MHIKAVIFDLDGTLIDSMQVWLSVDKEYLGKRNISVPDNLFSQVEGGNNFIEIAHFFKEKFGLSESIDEIMSEWTEMVAYHYEHDVKLKPGAKQLLEYLRKNNVKMGIGTSNSLPLAKIVLKANEILEFFDSIVAGCEEVRGKPFPDIFKTVANHLDVKPEECLVIEDVLAGVQAAKNAKMKVYGIYDKNSEHEKGQIKVQVDFYAENFRELLGKIKTLIIE